MKTFEEDEILTVYYTQIKKDSNYLDRYRHELPECPLAIWNYSWKDRDFPRVWSVLDFIDWIEKYKLKEVQDLGFANQDDPELELLHAKNKTLLYYPPYDLHQPLPEHQFDFFVFNQTIEHLYNPFLAISNIFKIMKPGGYVFTSVPTINIPHSTPIHFNGYNPMGLAMLFLCNDFEVIEIGQWGNAEYITKLFTRQEWPSVGDLTNIANEELNVVQCWILARKPL